MGKKIRNAKGSKRIKSLTLGSLSFSVKSVARVRKNKKIKIKKKVRKKKKINKKIKKCGWRATRNPDLALILALSEAFKEQWATRK